MCDITDIGGAHWEDLLKDHEFEASLVYTFTHFTLEALTPYSMLTLACPLTAGMGGHS